MTDSSEDGKGSDSAGLSLRVSALAEPSASKVESLLWEVPDQAVWASREVSGH
jgi:hypothetical protein